MPSLDVYNIYKEKIGEMELSSQVFDVEVKEHLIYDVVKMQLNSRRRGTASTKTRSQVSGGGAKPWRQKGTGRARAGSNTSPLWVRGGVVFGPHPRDYFYRVPKKVRKGAMKSVLTSKLRDGNLHVFEDFPLEKINTKAFLAILKRLNIENAIIVVDEPNEKLFKSARNLPHIQVMKVEGLNVYDVLRYKDLVFKRSALEKVEGTLLQ